MKKLYVRVQPKSGLKTFFRCGMGFSQAWQPVDVDDATAKRLAEEQMLEVSETKPDDYVDETPNAPDRAGNSVDSAVTDTPAAAPVADPEPVEADAATPKKGGK
jgi:hypothetical protein